MTRKLRCHAIVSWRHSRLSPLPLRQLRTPETSAHSNGLGKKPPSRSGRSPFRTRYPCTSRTPRASSRRGPDGHPEDHHRWSAAIPAIENGSLDISQTNYVLDVPGGQPGQEDQAVADMYQARPRTPSNIMVPKDSPIKTVADLKGKTVLVNKPQEHPPLATTSQLQVAGLAETDVNSSRSRSPRWANAIVSGQADAGWITERSSRRTRASTASASWPTR
ncbi:ABC transporter substrate-binding protein [Nonomuraea rubra]|uniref:ABC transporter substrate-binding protein n=1 Tax=Nonomuraea rubra TaxID=46180 RepID=UPI0031E71AD1